MGDIIRLSDRKIIYTDSMQENTDEELDMKHIMEEMQAQEMIDKLVDSASDHMREWLFHSGLAAETAEYYRDVHHLRESINALVCRSMNKEHPWHETIDALIEQKISEDGTIRTYWNAPEED